MVSYTSTPSVMMMATHGYAKENCVWSRLDNLKIAFPSLPKFY